MSYLKYIETTEIIDEGPTPGLTRLQHVDVVSVQDENGDPWFPENENPLEIVTESFWDPNNVFKVGETIKATTATYSGGVEPVNYWARFQFNFMNEDGSYSWIAAPKQYPGNVATEYSIVIPEDALKVKFFTNSKDSQENIIYASKTSVIPAVDVLPADPEPNNE